MDNQGSGDNADIFVTNDKRERAFKLVRSEGVLQAEVKTRTRDKKVPDYIYVDAMAVLDQVTAAMSQAERLQAYARLSEKLKKTE